MRTFVAFVLLYLLFLVQASVTPWWPDLVLLGLIIVSLHENRITSALAGAFAGLCLDVTSPAFMGTHLFTLAATGYGVAVLRTVFARLRMDQMINFCWRYVAPIAFLQVIIDLVIKEVF